MLIQIYSDRVAYTPERLKKIGEEAAREGSSFSLEDRMGLVADAVILAKAGSSKTSAALDLIESLKGEKECEPNAALCCDQSLILLDVDLVWSAIESQIAKVNKILWEQPEEVRENFKAFRRVRSQAYLTRLRFDASIIVFRPSSSHWSRSLATSTLLRTPPTPSNSALLRSPALPLQRSLRKP